MLQGLFNRHDASKLAAVLNSVRAFAPVCSAHGPAHEGFEHRHGEGGHAMGGAPDHAFADESTAQRTGALNPKLHLSAIAPERWGPLPSWAMAWR